MSKGRKNKLVGQTGEFLVASELSRRGLIATTFTGNVPDFDIIASSENGSHLSIQVKTIREKSWQFSNINKFVEISFDNKVQSVGPHQPAPVKNLVFVFVKLGDYGADEFFICTWPEVCEVLSKHHSEFLAKHGGVRPKNWESLHTALSTNELSQFKDRWDLIEKSLA